MTLSTKDIQKLSALAYLDVGEENSVLSEEISAIMDFVDQLAAVDTKQIAPLFHPFDLHQALRDDVVTEENCLEQLAAIAPLFEDDLYLVPKVLDSGNE